MVESRRRFLLVPSAVGRAHVTRLLLVARALRRQGAEVAFAFDADDPLLEREGFTVFRVPDVTVRDFSANVYAEYTPSFVEECVEAELKAIDAFRPDVVVADLRPTAAISARVARLPYVSVVNAALTKAFDPVELMIPKERSGLRHRAASIPSRGIQTLQKRALGTPFRKAARKYGVGDLGSLFDFLDGDLTLVADLREFFPVDDLPANHRYVGPLIWEPADSELPAHLAEPGPARALVYATTGNTGHERLVELVLEGFANEPSSEVVVTTGAYIDPAKFERAENVHVERFLPGSEVLKHAVVAIHPGGSGTTYQVLAQGIPSVVIPFNNEQTIYAWLVKRRGVGMALDASQTDGFNVRLAAAKVVQDADMRLNLWRFQELLANADGAKAAADELVSFVTATV